MDSQESQPCLLHSRLKLDGATASGRWDSYTTSKLAQNAAKGKHCAIKAYDLFAVFNNALPRQIGFSLQMLSVVFAGLAAGVLSLTGFVLDEFQNVEILRSFWPVLFLEFSKPSKSSSPTIVSFRRKLCSGCETFLGFNKEFCARHSLSLFTQDGISFKFLENIDVYYFLSPTFRAMRPLRRSIFQADLHRL